MILAFALFLSVSVPVYATSAVDYDPAECLPEEYKPYSDAYISFTTLLEEEECFVTISLEEFVSYYERSPNMPIYDFITEMVAYEMLQFVSREDQIVSADHDAVSDDYGVTPLSSDTSRYYDNIGNSLNSISISQNPNYSKYDIISQAARGDIVYETVGLIAGITGHVAIVQGKFFSTKYETYYIRTIESAVDGVVFGILDDTRYDERGVWLYYVYDATASEKFYAVDFCLDQLGKPYNYTGILGGLGTYCNVSRGSTSWYCSELIWAAYFNEGNGFNLNGSSVPPNLYSPYLLVHCGELMPVEITLTW